jgi:hypothetical protein
VVVELKVVVEALVVPLEVVHVEVLVAVVVDEAADVDVVEAVVVQKKTKNGYHVLVLVV